MHGINIAYQLPFNHNIFLYIQFSIHDLIIINFSQHIDIRYCFRLLYNVK